MKACDIIHESYSEPKRLLGKLVVVFTDDIHLKQDVVKPLLGLNEGFVIIIVKADFSDKRVYNRIEYYLKEHEISCHNGDMIYLYRRKELMLYDCKK